MKFNIGIGIEFAANILNVQHPTGVLNAGKRAPDCLLRAPGSQFPSRLFQLTKNNGQFFVLVFAGQPLVTSSLLGSLRAAVDSENGLLNMLPGALHRMLTIISGNATNADAALGVERFGDACYDVDNSAHVKYGFSVRRGGIVVLRPDGILDTAADLDDSESIVRYFSGFVTASEIRTTVRA